MPTLHDKDHDRLIGTITAEQLQDLIDLLVEESATDRDYYIDATTLDYLADNDADPELLAMLRAVVPAEGEGIEIEWRE